MDNSTSPQNNNIGTIQNAHTLAINNQVNIGNQQVIQNNPRQSLSQLLNPVTDASYIRNRKTSPPDSNCLPGTRKQTIRELKSWARSSILFNPTHIMWLYGYVGCGKSALAQAVAERVAESGKLCASFFFFSGSGDRSRASRFATTVASQVVSTIPHAAPFIDSAIRASDPQSMSLGTQFRKLVYEPIFSSTVSWAGLETIRSPYLIIIDGLDECDDKNDIADFIDQSLVFFEKHPKLPLRLLISSRVEEHIRTHLRHRFVQTINLADRTSADDIGIALRDIFKSAIEHDRVLQAYGQWPSERHIDLLVQHIGGSFIFMSRIVDFILSPSNDGLTPFERLPAAFSLQGLDGLYHETLSRSRDIPHHHVIIKTIALLEEPLSVLQLAHLLGIQTFEVVRVLINLHAVLHVPGDDVTPVTLCHRSLRDFLTTESRAGPFFANSLHHAWLARQCLQLRLDSSLDNPTMVYADCHFASHFRLANDAHCLDEVYAALLTRANLQPHQVDILSTLALLLNPEPFPVLANIISAVRWSSSESARSPTLTAEDLEIFIKTNPALVLVDTSGLRICQKSFAEFLTDAQRSRSFCIGEDFYRHLAYACMALLCGPRDSPFSFMSGGYSDPAFSYTLDYAGRHWEEHWKMAIDKAQIPPDNLEIRRSWIQSLLAHFNKSFSRDFPTIAASYVLLMDSKPCPLNRIPVPPPGWPWPASVDVSTLEETLSPVISFQYCRVIIRGIRALWGHHLDWSHLVVLLRKTWEDLSPALPPLPSFHMDLAKIGCTHLVLKMTRPPFALCFPFQGRRPQPFEWAFMNWAEHLVYAIRSGVPLSNDKLVKLRIRHWDFVDAGSVASLDEDVNPTPWDSQQLVEVLQRLRAPESKEARDRLIQNIKTAQQLVSPTLPPEYVLPEWTWVFLKVNPENRQWRFQSLNSTAGGSLLDVLAASIQLVECLEDRCSHLNNLCPLRAN